MSDICEVQCYFWEKPFAVNYGECAVQVGDDVIVETDSGLELGKVVSLRKLKEGETKEALPVVLRKTTISDWEQVKERAKEKKKIFEESRLMVRQRNLPMKIVDVAFSFDGQRLIFPFIANSRVDFRDLVRDLTTHFQVGIRLQQIGSRDVVADMGGFGPCGRPACCTAWIQDIASVSSELISLQQLEFRGSERLSGLCGRLKCCLAYEAEGYKVYGEKIPVMGNTVRTRSFGEGQVVARDVLQHSITLEDNKGAKTEVKLGCQRVSCGGCCAQRGCIKNK